MSSEAKGLSSQACAAVSRFMFYRVIWKGSVQAVSLYMWGMAQNTFSLIT